MKLKAAIEKLRELDRVVRECGRTFYHSTPLVEYEVGGKRVSYDLRDVLLMCAISGNNVLLSGKTGGGKTKISQILMTALFKEYGFLQVDVTLDVNKLRDFFFGAIKEGKRLSDAVRTTRLIDAPGVIVNECDRAPYEVMNILQGYLENGPLVFEGGKEVYPGVKIGDEHYQWKIATHNEGKGYYGARKMDKASRNRFGVEINLDIFEPSEVDKRKLVKHGGAKEIPKVDRSHLEDVLKLYEFVQKVRVGLRAEDFLLYFMRMNQCVKSPEGTKLSVNLDKAELCGGCHCRRWDGEICCDVSAPPERTIGDWRALSQAFAFYRVARHGGEPEVRVEDVMASAPFVLYSKLDIDPGRIAKRAAGSRWKAVNDVVKTCLVRWRRFVSENMQVMQKRAKGEKLDEEDLKRLAKYVMERDPWADDIRKYLELRKREVG